MEFTLTTRKFVFGMLLVLVLAFSTQGIADAQDTGRLTVRVDPFDGAPGSTATVTFTAIGADNQPAFITVNLKAIGGTLSRSSELTGTSGSGTGTVTLTRGNTPGNENYVTASADGYPLAFTSVFNYWESRAHEHAKEFGGGSSVSYLQRQRPERCVERAAGRTVSSLKRWMPITVPLKISESGSE